MVPHNPNLPSIDPRLLIDSDGPDALGDLIAQTGYLVQRRMLCSVWLLRSKVSLPAVANGQVDHAR